MKRDNILITGGAGYIGSHVTHLLTELGYDVTVLDTLYSGFRWAVPVSADFIQGSAGDQALVGNILRSKKITVVLHFAAHVEVEESVRDPLKYYQNNTAGTLALLSACREHDINKMIFSSTAAVYGEPQESIVTEQSALNPINPYGRSKLMSERMLADMAMSGQFRYVALRYFNVAGAKPSLEIGQSTPNATHLVKVAAQTALGLRRQIAILGDDYATYDGTCVRDYIHVSDLAKAHYNALQYLEAGEKSDVFNVGYGHGFSVKDVISAMKRVSGEDFPVVIQTRRPGDPAQLIANNAKVCQRLGWAPQYDDLDFICKTALEWEKKIPAHSYSDLRSVPQGNVIPAR